MEKEEKGVLSPLTPFDYNKYRDEMILPAMIKIVKLMGDNAEEIFQVWGSKDEEKSKAIQLDMSNKVLAILAESRVPRINIGDCLDIPQSFYVAISNLVTKHIKQQELEIMARVVGSKNPGDNRFDSNFITCGDLISTVIKVREETGNDVNDYHNIG